MGIEVFEQKQQGFLFAGCEGELFCRIGAEVIEGDDLLGYGKRDGQRDLAFGRMAEKACRAKQEQHDAARRKKGCKMGSESSSEQREVTDVQPDEKTEPLSERHPRPSLGADNEDAERTGEDDKRDSDAPEDGIADPGRCEERYHADARSARHQPDARE